jgi:hypothetical protein
MKLLEPVKQSAQFVTKFTASSNPPPEQLSGHNHQWTKGVCPNYGYADADVDREGILWCPACGYSRKGCYT